MLQNGNDNDDGNNDADTDVDNDNDNDNDHYEQDGIDRNDKMIIIIIMIKG